jgi:hypothetical protein
MANNHPVSTWTNRRQQGDWPQISNALLHQFGAGSSQYLTAIANEATLRTQTPGDGNGWGGALGVAWEWIADLANKADKPICINVPHRANDDYVRNLAVLLRDQTTTSKKIYVEYSNEVWNNGANFAGQYEWCVTRGLDANLAGLPTPGTSIQDWIASQGNGMNGEGQAREGYYAWRSAQVWTIFRNEFAARGKEGRLQFMLCGPTDDQGRLEAWRSILSSTAFNPSGLWPHMVCKSIYVGIGMPADLRDNTAAFWTALNEEQRQVFATDWSGIPGYKNIPYNQDKVRKHFSPTIPLGVYELGVELPNAGYLAAIRDARMEGLWTDLVLKARASMPLINIYAYCTQFSSGIKILALKEYVGQPDSGAPAWRGVISAGAGSKP